MANLSGVFRIGNEPQLRYTPSQVAVVNLSLAAKYGRKGDDGNYPTQWYDASLWGKLAEALVQYLNKGSEVYALINDLHIETYQSNGVERPKLVGRIQDIQLVGGQPHNENRPQNQSQPAQQQAPAQSAPQGGFDDFDQGIPY